MNYWLVKQDPANYPFEQFQKEKKTDWTGVRNYQARNFLRDMKKGDEVLFYHSGDEKAVVGFASVSKPAFPDPTADEDAWIAVELKAGKKLKTQYRWHRLRLNQSSRTFFWSKTAASR